MNITDTKRDFSGQTSIYEIGTVAYTAGDKTKYGLVSALTVLGRIILVLCRDGKQNDLVFTGKYNYNGREYNAKVYGDVYDFYFNIPETLVTMVEGKDFNNSKEFPII